MEQKTVTNTALWQGMHPQEHLNLLAINWVAYVVGFFPFAVLKPDFRAVAMGILIVLPVLLSITKVIRGHYRELFIHAGLISAISFAFYSEWAPPVVVIMFLGTSLLALVFLARPWGGWYFAFMSILVTFPIAMNMMGYNSDLPSRLEDEIRIIIGRTELHS